MSFAQWQLTKTYWCDCVVKHLLLDMRMCPSACWLLQLFRFWTRIYLHAECADLSLLKLKLGFKTTVGEKTCSYPSWLNTNFFYFPLSSVQISQCIIYKQKTIYVSLSRFVRLTFAFWNLCCLQPQVDQMHTKIFLFTFLWWVRIAFKCFCIILYLHLLYSMSHSLKMSPVQWIRMFLSTLISHHRII